MDSNHSLNDFFLLGNVTNPGAEVGQREVSTPGSGQCASVLAAGLSKGNE